jgi:phosphate-selective porin OprO/OprP
MNHRFITTRGAMLAALLVALLLPVLRAQVQPASSEIAALRIQIQELAQKLAELERRQQQAEVVTAASPAARVTMNDRGLTIASADAANQIRLRGLVQLDHRAFLGDGAGGTVNNAFVLRRARIIAEGQFARIYSFQIVPEFGGSSPTILDANITLALSPALQLKVGRFKVPVGLEQLQSDAWNFFNERSLATNLTPNRDLGIQAGGEVLGGRLSYAAGVFGGVPDGGSTNNTDFDNEKTVAGRIYAAPFRNDPESALQGLSLGLGASVGREKSAAGRTAGYRTDGQQTFFTYAAGTVADGRNWRLAPQVEFRRGPLGLLGEYVISAVNVRVAAAGPKAELRNRAWQVAGGYVLTGESSAFGGVVPAANFDPGAGTWGAFEVVARYATLDVDDNAFPTLASSATSADTARATAVGVNWYLSKAVRASFDFYHTRFTPAAGAPAVSGTPFLRQNERAFLTRLQLTF